MTWFLQLTITRFAELGLSDSESGPNVLSPISFTNGFGYMSVVKFVPGPIFIVDIRELPRQERDLGGTGVTPVKNPPGSLRGEYKLSLDSN